MGRLQYTNVTDGQTDTGRQQVPRLGIASRGKNGKFCVAVGAATRTSDILTHLVKGAIA